MKICVLKSTREAPTEKDQEAVEFLCRRVQRFWRDNLRRRDVYVYGICMQFEDRSRDLLNYGEAMFKRAKLLGLIEPDTTHRHLWGGTHEQYCGLAPVGGTTGVTYAPCGYRTTCHEIGHNLRLGHCHQDGDTYGNASCIQGRGIRGVCGAHREILGFAPIEADTDEIYMVPEECYKHGDYYLTTWRGTKKLHIQTRNGRHVNTVAALNPGQSYEDIYHLGVEHGVTRVGLGLSEAISPFPKLPQSNLITIPEGIYMDHRYPGHGVAVYNDTALVLGYAWEKAAILKEYPQDWFELKGPTGEHHSWVEHNGKYELWMNHPDYGRCSFDLERVVEGPGVVEGSKVSYDHDGMEISYQVGERNPELDYLMRPIPGTSSYWVMTVGDESFETSGPRWFSLWDYSIEDIEDTH